MRQYSESNDFFQTESRQHEDVYCSNLGGLKKKNRRMKLSGGSGY